LLNSLEIILKEERKEENSRKVLDYESQDTSMKVIKIIQSYKDYVNRVVWYQQ
jgi:UDP-N-acetylglucosamine 2-epimerase